MHHPESRRPRGYSSRYAIWSSKILDYFIIWDLFFDKQYCHLFHEVGKQRISLTNVAKVTERTIRYPTEKHGKIILRLACFQVLFFFNNGSTFYPSWQGMGKIVINCSLKIFLDFTKKYVWGGLILFYHFHISVFSFSLLLSCSFSLF